MNEVINVQLVDFKITSSKELVRRNDDDSYTILLNSRQASNQLKKAYDHAVGHIIRGECDCRNGSVQDVEMKAHGVLS